MLLKIITLAIFSLGNFLVVSPSLAAGASLSLSPVNGSLSRGCSYLIDVVLDTGGAATVGTDSILFYDPTRFKAEVTSGTIYSDYINTVKESDSKINISAVSSLSSSFTGKGTLGTLKLTVLADAPMETSTQIKFDYVSQDTKDSNVVEQSDDFADILSSVTDGTYSIVENSGQCSATPSLPGSVILPKGATSASGSATPIPLKKDPITGGNPPGFFSPTLILGSIGGFLTIIGILGLSLL